MALVVDDRQAIVRCWLRSDPPPFADARGLAADRLRVIAKAPDAGVVDHELPATAADASTAVVADRFLMVGLNQGALAAAADGFRCREPGWQSDEISPGCLPKPQGSSIGIDQFRVTPPVMGQHRRCTEKQLLTAQSL